MIIALLLCAGLVMGSFTSALVWRLHEQSKPKSKRALPDRQLSMAYGRSVCPHCKHVLAAADLVPVFSWLWLRGCCRYCHKPIQDTPLPELLLAIAFVASYLVWPYGYDVAGLAYFVVWLVSLTAFAALIAYDMRWMLLPNRVVYPLLVFAGLHVVVQAVLAESGSGRVLLGAVGGAAVGGGLFYLLFQFSDGKWIGGGDVKLGFVLGLLLMKPELAMLMLFVASFIGVLYSLPLMAARKLGTGSRIPFGPFLMVATVIVLLWGTPLISWYVDMTNTMFLP